MSSAFPEIEKIPYEGPDSRNPLAFRWYNADEVVEGKTMKEHFRFSVVYWHTFRGTGSDPFGAATMIRPWDDGSDSLENAERRVAGGFRVHAQAGRSLLRVPRPRRGPGRRDLAQTNKNLDRIVKLLKKEQQRTGIKLLWGTANLFSNPRYVHGAATTCNADVFAYAAAQVKKCLEVTKELGGVNYVFWGGREGYQNLFNTDMKRELDHLGCFLHLAVDYAKEIGFTGQFLIEPKPKEPTKHQYDSDAAACINFLRAYDLLAVFQAEHRNQPRDAGRAHDDARAGLRRPPGVLGSIDANTGDMLLGWDTDQFPTSFYLTAEVMLILLKYGGLNPGGVNFDAKVRRESFEPSDLFHAHVGGMDAFARGLKIAAAIRADGELAAFVKDRYGSWDTGIGADIESGKADFKALEAYMLKKREAGGQRQRPAGNAGEPDQPLSVRAGVGQVGPACRAGPADRRGAASRFRNSGSQSALLETRGNSAFSRASG